MEFITFLMSYMTWSPEQEDASELKSSLPLLYIYVPRCLL